VYLPAFAAQREPLEAWVAASRGETTYRWHGLLALDGGSIAGGVTYELYPASRCGFVTYLVVAPAWRQQGLGRRLFESAAKALYEAGALVALGEANDPRIHGDSARPRLARFERWGARVLDVRYVQPSLGEGLARDRGLCLIAHPPVPRIAGATVRAFIEEIYSVTEGGAPDPELEAVLAGIPEEVGFRDRL
jgi:GNAT superfamily N-acetyltransferase